MNKIYRNKCLIMEKKLIKKKCELHLKAIAFETIK